jgi:MFS family permease
MSAKRNLRLITPYLALSLEGVCHGVYLLWLTVHKGISPFTAALALAGGDVALMALEVPTGVFADRLGARWSLVLGSAFQVLGLALLWRAGTLPWLVVGMLAIALGDAIRHGADEALVYRSCAALGEAETFGRRFARARAWSLAALVALTALGGCLAGTVGFDVAWALEAALAAGGFGLALAMTDLPAALGEAPEDDEGASDARSVIAALAARVPWPLLVPAAMVGTLAEAGQLLAQTTQHEDARATLLGFVIAGAILLEALGAALVAHGVVPVSERALDGLGLAALGSLGLLAAVPVARLPAMVVILLGAGVAPAIRSALVQRDAREGERATVASAAGAVDMIGKTVALPLAAWLYDRVRLPGTAAGLGAAAVLLWAFAARRRGPPG